jgi:hypothetical protein
MMRTLSILFITVLCQLGLIAKPFHVYSPSSKENTLWIVKATPKGESLKLEVAEKVKVRLLGPCNYRSSQQTPSLCQCYRWRSREGTGSGCVLEEGRFLPETSEY